MRSPIARDAAMEARIAAIVAVMTVEQKVGQMTQPDIRWVTPADVQRHAIGSVLNGAGGRPGGNKLARVAEWRSLAQAFHAASMATDLRVKVPIIWGTDAVHGHNNVHGATVFPHHIGLGAANDPALVRELGVATARAVRATGIDWVFAPTVAVARDDRWGRTYESFSEDPRIVASLGGAYVRGLQSGLGRGSGVVATAKHFIGDGGTDGGLDQGVTLASRAEMIALHGPGYVAALGAGAQAVMASFNSWHESDTGVVRGKLHGSRRMLTEVLKKRMGFDGIVVSDWNAIAQVPGCRKDRCAQAINAGIDMVMVPEDWKAFIDNTVAQVRRGEIAMARIDDAVTRILRVKARAGLFDRPAQPPAQADDLAPLQARALARRAVRESLVLLKNNGRLLPLARDKRLLVVGKSADSLGNQTGGWTLSWQGQDNRNADFPAGETVLAGLRAAAGPGRVVFSESAEGVDVRGFDAVIAVLGETPYAEGAGDIPPSGTLRHSGRHPEDLAVLQRVAGQGVPVVTVFVSGRPLHVNDLLNLSDAFVAAWLPGTEGGGIADVLMRRADGTVDHDFRGRLSFSWPRSACQTPLNAGDAGYAPLFAFGYGLRYAGHAEVGLLDTAHPSGGCAAPSELPIFNQVARGPYALHLGSLDGGWREVDVGSDPDAHVDAPAQRPVVRVTTVQMHTQQDAKRVAWVGGARFFARSAPRAALTAYPDAVLAFDTLVSQAPHGRVTLAMECGKACRGALDVTKLFAADAAQAPRSFKIPLACFAARGADLARIDVPFSVSTEAPFTAAFARIRVLADAAGDVDTLRCNELPAVPSI